jgi:hypothetical protein
MFLPSRNSGGGSFIDNSLAKKLLNSQSVKNNLGGGSLLAFPSMMPQP